MRKSIIDLSAAEAKNFLLTSEAYCDLDLPCYFSFQNTLKEVSTKFTEILQLNMINQAKKLENINHILFHNKDGKYAWRKFQLIHPLIYVSLVNLITQEDNWQELHNVFTSFQKTENILCQSIPVISATEKKKKQKAEQISQWVENIEKKSIELALEYKYLYKTDIVDCYNRIYTHSISWALHSKEEAKQHRQYNDLLGNKIDGHLQAMNYGQSIGIPQGSILFHLIAEIILGYADVELEKKLKNYISNKDYYILRYRDDYRIFVNDNDTGEKIIKALSEILLDLNFSLNPLKTSFCSNIIEGSIKPDKIHELKYEKVPKKINNSYELVKQLLIIHQIALSFPNSGTITRRLTKIMELLNKNNYRICKGQEKVLSGILVDISYNSPNCFPLVATIISGYITNLPKKEQKTILENIYKKINYLPNIGFIEIWLQRISLGLKSAFPYNELLCKFVEDQKYINHIFDSTWINESEYRSIMENIDFIDRDIVDKLNPKININEVSIFVKDYHI